MIGSTCRTRDGGPVMRSSGKTQMFTAARRAFKDTCPSDTSTIIKITAAPIGRQIQPVHRHESDHPAPLGGKAQSVASGSDEMEVWALRPTRAA